MQRILFVDDDRRILSGLRRQLHGGGIDWETEFAPGGPEALEVVAARSFDVVVSDMLMPLVDGAVVLARVAEVQPRAARLVLSGHADPDKSRLPTSCAHRYLHKPCTTEVLVLEIRQALSLRAALDGLSDPALDALWSHPACRVEGGDVLLTALNTRPHTLSEEAQALFAEDVELWRRVVEVASGADGERLLVSSTPTEVAARLGATAVLELALGVRLLQTADRADGEAWLAGARRAALAATVAREQGLADEAIGLSLLAGLLHPLVEDRRPLRREALAWLLPTWVPPEAVVAALVAGEDERPGSGAAAALLAARLLDGDPDVPGLCRRLELAGWGSRLNAWRHRGGAERRSIGQAFASQSLPPADRPGVPGPCGPPGGDPWNTSC